jgi:RNA polymerase sigma-70 factor, ECF subfamily
MLDFETLYTRYAADVYRFALSLSGRRADAEDIVSETFIRVWTARDRVEIATVKGYLLAIARNLFLNDLRRGKRRAGLDERLPDAQPGPAVRAEDQAELDAVLALLQRLPEVDRAALLLRAQEDMPYDEIAAVLGLPVSTAKVKVHRARLKLAEWRTSSEVRR